MSPRFVSCKMLTGCCCFFAPPSLWHHIFLQFSNWKGRILRKCITFLWRQDAPLSLFIIGVMIHHQRDALGCRANFTTVCLEAVKFQPMSPSISLASSWHQHRHESHDYSFPYILFIQRPFCLMALIFRETIYG